MTHAVVSLDLVLFFFSTLIGAVVAGVAGFAFGLIASAIWLHIISPAQTRLSSPRSRSSFKAQPSGNSGTLSSGPDSSPLLWAAPSASLLAQRPSPGPRPSK